MPRSDQTGLLSDQRDEYCGHLLSFVPKCPRRGGDTPQSIAEIKNPYIQQEERRQRPVCPSALNQDDEENIPKGVKLPDEVIKFENTADERRGCGLRQRINGPKSTTVFVM
jgi:hypothetical protein